MEPGEPPEGGTSMIHHIQHPRGCDAPQEHIMADKEQNTTFYHKNVVCPILLQTATNL